MTKEFKYKHRPICDVLEEIKAIADRGDEREWEKIHILCNEALTYAKSMQARLQQNKLDMLRLSGVASSTSEKTVSQDAGELIAHGKLAADILEQVRAGKIDLRPVGELLTGKWDQDVPAGILRAAVVAASADEQVSTLAAREAASARMREALLIFADDENWRYGRRLDPNGSRFDGTDVARAALAVQSPVETKGEENDSNPA